MAELAHVDDYRGLKGAQKAAIVMLGIWARNNVAACSA